MMKLARIVAVVASAVLFLGLAGSPAFAQAADGEAPRITPGWVFTPTVSLGITHDDNPLLAGGGNPTPDDILTNVRPGGDLTFTGKHTFVGTGYRGSIQRYRTLDEYDNYGQGGYVELRHQPSRRVSLFVRDNASVSPTTDLVEVAGLPFSRTGTRSNDLNGGLTASLTKRLQFSGAYAFQWLEFDRPDDPSSPVLQGGRAHRVTLGGRQAINSRLKVGGDYSIQRATLGQTVEDEHFMIQDLEGTASYELAPTVTIEGGAGISHLALPGEEPRTGPAFRAALRKRTEHALLSISAMRSFVPAFGLGGAFQNQEVLATVRVPFLRNRAYADGSIAWRDSEPVLVGGLGLKSLVALTTLGYSFQPWLRLEAFYNGTFQDSTVVGGNVDRNRFGVQFVTAHPMRLR
jgi:hypothetical protein